jgi:outer membrane lipoprotein SlyB
MRTITGLKLLAALLVVGAVSGCDRGIDADAAPTAVAQRAVAPTPSPVAPRACIGCGTVSAIDTLKVKGDGSGAGAVMGAVIGGVIGHQFGGGRGQDVATAAGVIGGAVAGHQIERSVRGDEYYRVTVAMEGGGTRTVDVAMLNGLSVGARVRVVGQDLELV